ncbi:MAG: hypothetical protein QOF36_192 [Microbacteriaceae bacterium]|jgi:hypothetical protein|nr:hypothetical protein [Microbacteriaceae bacterium]
MRYLERAIWAGVISLAGSILIGMVLADPALWFMQNVLNYSCDTSDAGLCQRVIASVLPVIAAVACPAIVLLVLVRTVVRERRSQALSKEST